MQAQWTVAATGSGARTSLVAERSAAARRELIRLLAATQYFTCLPVPAWVGHSTAALTGAIRYLPAVGVLVGSAGAALFLLVSLLWTPLIAAVVSTIGTVVLTGALHEDGLADSMDGLGGGQRRERALAIMQDPRIGTFGALALTLALVLKVACLQAAAPARAALFLVIGHAVSRFGVVVLMASLPYVRHTDASRARPLAQEVSGVSITVAGIVGLAPVVTAGSPAFTGVAAAALTCAFWGLYLRRRLGGYTGDGLGAGQQLAELAFYVGAIAEPP
jgi:adenosylcobinamide-GDP ribazoletransferase